eukprot:m.385994 g.385994  ORF g.385994 m.385994 type:complete len:238 (+) comp56294_c0_seq10:154-867(+)
MLPHGVQESQSPTSRKPSSFAEEVLSKATELGRPKGGLAPPSVAPPVQPDEDSGLPPPPDDDISHRPSTTSYADIDLPAPPPLEVVDVYDREMPVHYVVLYDYEATQPDDLTLVEGSSLLLLLERSDGWSQGINAQGQLGFFPHSYVRPLEHGEHTTMPSVCHHRNPCCGPSICLPLCTTYPSFACALFDAQCLFVLACCGVSIDQPLPLPLRSTWLLSSPVRGCQCCSLSIGVLWA